LDSFGQTIQQLQSQNSEFCSENSELRGLNETLSVQLADSVRGIDELKNELIQERAASGAALDSANAKYAALQSEFNRLERSEKLFAEKYSSIDAIRSALLKAKASLDERCSSLSMELAQTKSVLDVQTIQLKDTIAASEVEKESLNRELADLHESLSKASLAHANEIAELQASLDALKEHDRKLQRNLKLSRKEAKKSETRILQLLRTAAPQIMAKIAPAAGLVAVVGTFLMQWPIFLLATATQKITAKFTQVGRAVEDMNATLARLAPRTECMVQLFEQYETRLNGLSQIIEHSVTFESLATTLHRILGTDSSEDLVPDQQEIQSLLEQVKKKVRETEQRVKIAPARAAQGTKPTQMSRR
jgi:DNA repair exonuclease SbcCD ATPase subunit